MGWEGELHLEDHHVPSPSSKEQRQQQKQQQNGRSSRCSPPVWFWWVVWGCSEVPCFFLSSAGTFSLEPRVLSLEYCVSGCRVGSRES